MSSLEQRCVNTIRTLSIDGVQQANSGHPGMPMGMADAAFVLWTKFLRHNPSNPKWVNRDRFILSAGHGSMLIYSLLHLTGYDLPLEELKNFRQLGSKTPGHPEYGHTPGVETTTGPLGQGFATGVGMAIAERHLAAKVNSEKFNIIDHTIYAIVSDGDLMEGISQEAASLAGHLKLGNLVYLYDDNSITIDGSTDLAFTEDVPARFTAYGWHTITVDGHDRVAIAKAIEEAKSVTDRPSLISCKTRIGFGSPNKEGTAASHGAPLGADEVRLTKEAYGMSLEPFHIDDDVLAFFRQAKENGNTLESDWNDLLKSFSKEDSKRYQVYSSCVNNELPPNLDDLLPDFPESEKGLATRKSSSMVLDALGPHIPGIVGGSADLGASNLTEFKGSSVFSSATPSGNYINYGVREHAMCAIMNGLALHGSARPYGGTFLIFTDYCKPAIRLAALMKLPVIYVYTHDSIGLGEDGPTHQPIEQIASVRCIPNMVLIRPADGAETAQAWKLALQRNDGPTMLALTRQNLPELPRTDLNPATLVAKGAYTFAEAPNGNPDGIIIATGSELHIAHQAWKRLTDSGRQIRLVSMPSWELFLNQDKTWRDSVLPPSVTKRVAIEAGSTFGWHRFTGDNGTVIGIDRFGDSAPYQDLYKAFGITADAVVEAFS